MSKGDRFPPIDEMLETIRGAMGAPQGVKPCKEEAAAYCIANTWGVMENKAIVLELAHLKKLALKFADPANDEGRAVALVRCVLDMYFKSLQESAPPPTSKAIN